MTLRLRCPVAHGHPTPGCIVMGTGLRVRRAYRVLAATKVKSTVVMLGIWTWRLTVEGMSAERGKAEIAAGHPHWTINWDRRG
jgi:hypothetical protein